MLKFVTKKEYWGVVDSKILDEIKTKRKFTWHYTTKHNYPWHLKSIQDGIAFSYLNEFTDKCLAEIGGGNSRLLPALAKKNTCFNIEEFKGVGGGPQKEIKFKQVTNILANVGGFSDSIEDEQFDAIFSISVVEHVSDGKLLDFFKDCHRSLKPSGLMIHLVDVYLEDALGDNNDASRRVCAYGSFLNGELFIPLERPSIRTGKDVVFSTAFATNPDNMMEQWNRTVPQLRNKREKAQSCTLLMIGRKTGPAGDDSS
jgi:SAM-dependent methyltransferase